MLSLFSASPSLNVGVAPVTAPRAATSMAEARAVKATPLPASVKPGVVTGQALWDLLEHAKENKYAIPAVNVVSSCSIASCLEAAKSYGGPMIIQFSRGGGQFICGKTADNTDDAACIAGTVAVRASLLPTAGCSTQRLSRGQSQPGAHRPWRPLTIRPPMCISSPLASSLTPLFPCLLAGRARHPRDRQAVRRPRDPSHRSLPALVAAVVRWPDGRQRGVLQEERYPRPLHPRPWTPRPRP